MDAQTTIRQSQLRDQFSDTTRQVRRNLMIFASAAILLGLPDIKLDSFLGLDLSSTKAAPLAIGAVSMIVVYELISFAVYAVIDHMRWKVEPRAVLLNSTTQGAQQLGMLAGDYSGYFAKMERRAAEALPADPILQVAINEEIDRVRGVTIEASRYLQEYHGQLEQFERLLASHNTLQYIRIYALDWAVPLLVGLIAASTNYQEIQRLILAIVGTFN